MRGDFVLRFLHRLRPGAEVVSDLVGREVFRRQPRARFEADNLDACLGKRQDSDAAGGAHPDHDDIGLLEVVAFQVSPVGKPLRPLS